ncbi:hypothetical protein WQQ_25530 [Hydrocarboniphaga effusa AP103]|uniref:Uncharacterized protein n=1 Tax=Hydrocarboniphaga effusa AP103 TaxID=1172194 RepID=I8HZH1_9GAMM|nr:hypothetical protein WQQ_25530 [Hydrocarboniphaga effusa AP103]
MRGRSRHRGVGLVGARLDERDHADPGYEDFATHGVFFCLVKEGIDNARLCGPSPRRPADEMRTGGVRWIIAGIVDRCCCPGSPIQALCHRRGTPDPTLLSGAPT